MGISDARPDARGVDQALARGVRPPDMGGSMCRDPASRARLLGVSGGVEPIYSI